MRAIVYRQYGSPAVLSLEEVTEPELEAHDVLVRVHAASVNSWDRDNLTGKNRGFTGWRKPSFQVLGGDIAGTVTKTGPAVTRFKVGDAVFGDLSGGGWGAFAEYARAPEDALAIKPSSLDFAQAAAMPQAAVIALQGIRDNGRVSPGQRVLINGAGGGVGSFAVQLAKAFGAEVTGVDSAPKLELVKVLGADHVLDYQSQDYTQGSERYDFILDCELHRSPLDCLRVLAPKGRLTVVGGDTKRILQAAIVGGWLALRHGKHVNVLLHTSNKALDHLAQLAADGQIRSAIEREYPLADTPQALQRMCDGSVAGKAVIVMNANR